MRKEKDVQRNLGRMIVCLCLVFLGAVTFVGCSALSAQTKAGQETAEGQEPLFAALKDKDWRVRRDAVQALGKSGNVRAVEPLVAALRDKSWDVRVVAANALLSIGKPAVKSLIAALKDEVSDVRRTALITLGKIGTPRAVEALILVAREKNSGIRQEAVTALGKIRGTRAIRVLNELAQNDSDSRIRPAAQKALK